MKITADQLLKIAGIAPSTTLRSRLNESAGKSRTRRTVKEAAANEIAISAAVHKQLTDMLTWLNARPKGFPVDIFEHDEVGTALDGVLQKELGDDFNSCKLNAGVLSCLKGYKGGRVVLTSKSGRSVKESVSGRLTFRQLYRQLQAIENPNMPVWIGSNSDDGDPIYAGVFSMTRGSSGNVVFYGDEEADPSTSTTVGEVLEAMGKTVKRDGSMVVTVEIEYGRPAITQVVEVVTAGVEDGVFVISGDGTSEEDEENDDY